MLAKFVFTFMTLPTYSYEDKVNVGESPLNVKSLQVPEYVRDYRVPRIIIWHFYQTSQIDVGHSRLLWQVSLVCLSQIGSPLQNKGQTSTKSNVLTEIWVRGAYRTGAEVTRWSSQTWVPGAHCTPAGDSTGWRMEMPQPVSESLKLSFTEGDLLCSMTLPFCDRLSALKAGRSQVNLVSFEYFLKLKKLPGEWNVLISEETYTTRTKKLLGYPYPEFVSKGNWQALHEISEMSPVS